MPNSNSSANFTRLKINDTKGTYPIIVGDNESDAYFYIKHEEDGNTKAKLRGDLFVEGNINLTGLSEVDNTMLFYSLMPKGIIAAFQNTGNELPQGWALCNGQTIEEFITPDLTNKFIRGAESLNTSGTTNDNDFGENKKTNGELTLVKENLPPPGILFQMQDLTHTLLQLLVEDIHTI